MVRITIALTLAAAMVVIVIAETFLPGEQVSFPTLALLGVMVLTLVGLEARDLMRGGR